MRRKPEWAAVLVAVALGCAAIGWTMLSRGEAKTVLAPPDCRVLDMESMPSTAAALVRQQAWHAHLRSNDHGARRVLSSLYGAAGNSLWLTGGRPTSQALAMLTALRSAGDDGLEPQDYLAAAIQPSPTVGHAREQPCRPQAVAQFEVDLSAAVLALVSDLHYGRIDPRAVGFDLGTARPDDLDLGAVLQALSRSQNLEQTLASLEPHFYHYRLLKQALVRYRRLALQYPGLTELPPPGPHAVKLGDHYVGAPALRALLIAVGDLTIPTGGSVDSMTQTLDPTLMGALERFQRRHGLKADGALGRETFAALTTPFAVRVRQIALTLERWRWLPPFQTPPIIVNVPQFRLFAFRSTADRVADILQMDVIVGRTFPRTQTPVFVADMKYVIFRPYWDVPNDIARRELLPQIRSNPGYLAAQRLEIVRGSSDDTAKPMLPTPDNLADVASGTLRVRQKPGPDNALGLIKFVLPNRYDVYLHSTPARQLFAESRRAFSHGCIRVSDPVALAQEVLRDTPNDWTPTRIQAAMDGVVTQRVNLSRPIQVMILYATVLATEAGEVLFFDDIYGYDRRLERLLALAQVVR